MDGLEWEDGDRGWCFGHQRSVKEQHILPKDGRESQILTATKARQMGGKRENAREMLEGWGKNRKKRWQGTDGEEEKRWAEGV